MKGRKILTQLAAVAALAVLVAAPALAAPHTLAKVHSGASSVEWQPAVADVGLALSVSGPQGFYLRQEFKPGEPATFSVFDKAGQVRPAGRYNWEITPIVHLDSATAGDLQAARDAAPGATGALQKAGKLPAVPKLQSGSFSIADQAIVASGEQEPGAGKPAGPSGNRLSSKAQVIATDLIVQGSECVGLDCTSSENFGFDTLRLKENNLRIKFEDTSNSGSFPSTDWQLTANDSTNGGANKFSIDDITDGKTPFTIIGNAPSNSIYVADSGNVGLGTSTPVVELHIADGDTPTLRLEQNNSSGFAAQTWDVAGNETNFFVRDVTNGSKLPFKIIPGAPNNSLYVNNAGNVGLGTASPDASLHVVRSDGTAAIHVQDKTTTEGARELAAFENDGTVTFRFTDTQGTNSDTSDDWNWIAGLKTNNQFIITQLGTIGTPLWKMDSSGNVTATSFNPSSSRTLKEGFSPIEPEEVLDKVVSMPISQWSYKNDVTASRHLGPVAEDFRAAFGLGADNRHINVTDLGGVALAAIQGLNQELQKKDQKIDELSKELETLKQTVDQLAKQN
jgi:hypothetical protein